MPAIDRIYLNPEVHAFINELKDELGKYGISTKTMYQIALAKGLRHMPDNYKARVSSNSSIRHDAFEDDIFKALVRQKRKNAGLSRLEMNECYERYFNYGTLLLRSELEEVIAQGKCLFKLVRSEVPVLDTTKVSRNKIVVSRGFAPIKLSIGIDKDGEEVSIILNDSRHGGIHMGIIGGTGSGKTQLGFRINAQVKQASPSTNIIFLDYKGDVSKNEKYIHEIGMKTVDVAKNRLPFNPFHLEKVSDKAIMELRDLFASNQKQMGHKQKAYLYEILQDAYQKTRIPDFSVIYQVFEEYYQDHGLNPDSLWSWFQSLQVLDYFAKAGDETYTSFMEDNIVFDFSEIDNSTSAKGLLAYFILHRICSEALQMEDAPIDPETGLFQIRTVVMIDEGHNYMKTKNPLLEKMLRELRSKGVCIVVLSQNYKDYCPDEINFTTLMKWVFMMGQKGVTPKELSDALGIPLDAAKSIRDIGDLPMHGFYMRKIRERDKYYTYVQGCGYN